MLPVKTRIIDYEGLCRLHMRVPGTILDLPVIANLCPWGREMIATGILVPFKCGYRSRPRSNYQLLILRTVLRIPDKDRRLRDIAAAIMRRHLKINTLRKSHCIYLRRYSDLICIFQCTGRQNKRIEYTHTEDKQE